MTSSGRVGTSYSGFIARSFGTFLGDSVGRAFQRLSGKSVDKGKIGAFWGRHWAHLLLGKPITILTNSHYIKREGGCSRALMTMYAISYCRKFNIPYRHTPMQGVHHAEGEQQVWDRRWEDFFNLGEGEEPVSGREAETFDLFLLTFIKKRGEEDLTRFIRPPLPEFRPIYYFVFSELPDGKLRQIFEQMFVDLLLPNVPDFRARYRLAHQRPAQRQFTVCMHVRRGDVDVARQDMWTDTASFLRTRELVEQALKAQGIAPRFLIFSQGKREDFAGFEGEGVEFHLDADPFWTLEQMIDADLLVMSKSSFSYVAGMLCDGLKLFEPCQLPAMPGWIMRDAAGEFDAEALRQRIAAYLAEREAGAGVVPISPRP